MFVLEVIYAVGIFFSNPINMFPVYEILYKIGFIKNRLDKMDEKNRFWGKYLIRICSVILCFLICFFIPSFIKFLSFCGSFLFPILGIYIPVMLNYSYFKRKN